jgi:hypothetical protein
MFHCLTFSCRCFTLYVSAYMAIFKCVGCFYFHIPERICFAGFTCMRLPFARFHLWGGLNMRYYFDIMGYYHLLLLCYFVLLWYVRFYLLVLFCCSVFHVNFAVSFACLFTCLFLLFVCFVLLSGVYFV